MYISRMLVFSSAFAEVAFYVCFALFVIISLVHLYFCFRMIPKWRKGTKPFCMLFLGGAMASLVPQFPLVWISCLLSAAGDVLLINNKIPKYFVCGAVVFACAHTLNVVNQTTILVRPVAWYVWLIFAVVAVGAGVAGYLTRGKENAAMASVGATYACFHILNVIFAVVLMCEGRTTYEPLILIGYVLYVISDLVVNYVTNKHDVPRRDFYIMTTYLAGQTLIYFGLAFALLV